MVKINYTEKNTTDTEVRGNDNEDKKLIINELPNGSGIERAKKLTSGLSLKSIKEKKAHQIKQLDVVVNQDDLPKESVNQKDLEAVWKTYINILDGKGEKILSSIFRMETPTLMGSAICLKYSNNTTKIEVERAQGSLLAYLRKALKNYSLYLDITVDEEIEKKFTFTAREKYLKLVEKNPNLEVLKNLFGLDID